MIEMYLAPFSKEGIKIRFYPFWYWVCQESEHIFLTMMQTLSVAYIFEIIHPIFMAFRLEILPVFKIEKEAK